jgi:U3 small nucleolar RNA-associated protein 14
MVEDVPHPFQTREQYERFLRNPLGKEWNTSSVHEKLIRPQVPEAYWVICAAGMR